MLQALAILMLGMTVSMFAWMNLKALRREKILRDRLAVREAELIEAYNRLAETMDEL